MFMCGQNKMLSVFKEMFSWNIIFFTHFDIKFLQIPPAYKSKIFSTPLLNHILNPAVPGIKQLLRLIGETVITLVRHQHVVVQNTTLRWNSKKIILCLFN